MKSAHLERHWQAGLIVKRLAAVIEGRDPAGCLALALREMRERTEARQFKAAGEICKRRPVRALDPKVVAPLLDLIVRAEIAVHAHSPERYADEIHAGMQAFAALVMRWADPASLASIGDRMPLLYVSRHAELLETIAQRIALQTRIANIEAEWGRSVDLNGWRHAG